MAQPSAWGIDGFLRGGGTSVNQAIGVRVGEHHAGLEGCRFLGIDDAVGHNYHDVALLHLAGCGTVEANHARTALTGYCVGVEALAVVVVDDIHALAFHYSGGIHQILVNGDAANVVQIGTGDSDAVDF